MGSKSHNYSWGGVAPDNLFFPHYRYIKHQCKYWQYYFYNSWEHHGRAGKLNKQWFDFSRAYEWIKSEPILIMRINFAHRLGIKYVFETDKGKVGFGPNMRFVPERENMIQREKDHPDMFTKRNTQKRVERSIEGHKKGIRSIDPFGNEVYWDSATDFAVCYGNKNLKSTVHSAIKTGTKITLGALKGWSFSWA